MTHGPQRHAGAALAAAPAPVSDLRGDDAPPDVATATRRWFDAWTPPELPVDRLPLHLAIGRVAAQALRAHVANPAHDLAAMDGIVVTTAAIQRDGALPAGGYDLIDTGDPVPPGRDAVVPSEQLEYGPDRTIHLVAAVPPGRHIRSAGEDVAEEELLVAAGHRLRPVDAAVLASAGYDEVPVMARPRVTVIPTGDEIRPAGTIPVRGEIVDSNSTLIAGTLAAHGAEVAVTEIVPDQPELLASRIRATAIRSDLIMVIAGSSAGRDDHTAAVVRAVGRVVVHHLPLRPGHPVLLGTAHERPVIGVPGYPVAAARVTDLFAVPALARMDHRAIPRDRALVAVLGAPLASSPHTDEQVPVRLRDDVSGPPVAEPMQRGAGSLTSLMRADGLVRLPLGCAGWDAGHTVLVHAVDGSATAPPPREGRPSCATR